MSATHTSALSSPSQRGFFAFVGGSVVVHVVALVAWVVVSGHRDPPISPDDAIIKTKLVKLGKKRDEKLLPRKAPPKPPAPKAPVPQPPKPEAKPEPKVAPPKPEPKPEPKAEAPKPTAKGILKDFAESNETKERPDLSKLIEKVTDEGDEKGSKIGEEISGRLKAEYNDKVLTIIRSNLTAPATIDPAERIRLKTKVVVHIGSDGSVTSASVSSSSGNALFDNAALRAAKTSKFPPPPLQLRPFYGKGVVVGICPGQCA